ncbi:MAG: branched-chain amino acid transaminase [Gammaproteobacteria bacterium]
MYGSLKETGVIWFDGKLIPWQEAQVHVLTHSLHYGTAIFEGVRAYECAQGTAIFRLEEHTKRFFGSAQITGMPLPYSQQELNEAQKEVVRANKLNSCYIRPLAFYGDEHLGIDTRSLSTHVIIAAWAWGSYLGEEALESGIKVRTSSLTRHHVNATMTKAKVSANYLNSCFALREAQSAGCQEALLLDPQGYVAEGSAENIFIVRDGVIYTPMLTSCLAGITRDTIFTLAKDLGYTVQEKLITRDEVYIADEVFFTGTAAEVTPVRELDCRNIGKGIRGPITDKLQNAYFDVITGKNAKYNDWLARI